ncbi:NAD-dependent epimerase/dehydratase family protein [Paenibacillus sp. USDA918EY]|uniref:NAD-dependent epimerase/dehydratase family protein n=1 Tax=Paenibacillus sp. USDA918EY TaxID=2689575 RepID=UPI00135B82F5|nr:NAD-dependent epimerase/dehydratase family protein [Paenibacillus sp. USDA918EY]
MNTVVVTGGAGFIGSHLVKHLIEKGHGVHVIDDLSVGKAANLHPDAVLHQEDIRTPSAFDTIVSLRPDTVFHLAAQADVQHSIRYPREDMDINVLGTLNILEASRQSCVRKFVFASTSGVYGNLEKDLLEEHDSTVPISFYGLSKYAAEHVIRLYGELFDLDWTVLRFANVYGPGQTSKGEGGVVAIFLNQLRQGVPLTINGDGEQTRDFIYVEDVASALAASQTAGARQIFHVSTGEATSVNRLVELLRENHGSNIQCIHREDRAGDIRHSRLSNTRALTHLNWQPAYRIGEGLKRTYQSFFR